jgi:hypothetical protein
MRKSEPPLAVLSAPPPVKLPPLNVTRGAVVVLDTDAPSAIRKRLFAAVIVAPFEESSGLDRLRVVGRDPLVAKPFT